MNRYSAFATHFAISLVIFAIFGFLILYVWYPGFLFATDGGWQGIRIVALVDLVLGPLLTLIVFKPGKPSLKFDLCAIAAFQACALGAGAYVVYSERPIAIVYSDGYFHSMTKDDYVSAGRAVPNLEHFPGRSPKWVTVGLPDDYAAQSTIRGEAWRSRTPLPLLEQYYKPFEPNDIAVDDDPISAEEVATGRGGDMDTFLAQHGGEVDDYLFFPLAARYGFSVIAMRKLDETIIGIVAVEPDLT